VFKRCGLIGGTVPALWAEVCRREVGRDRRRNQHRRCRPCRFTRLCGGDAVRRIPQARERAPVAWHPYKNGAGFLALTGYDEVLAVSRDSATWSSEMDAVYFDVPGPDDLADMRGVMMLTMDPPRHTAWRALVNKGFTPSR
jgi:cytochrome P450